MLKVSIINNRYDWSDPTDKGIQFINPTFIYFKDYYEYYSSFKDKVEWVIPAWKDLTGKEYVSWVLDNELDEFLSYFPLLKSREKLQQQDSIWEKICRELLWQYIPSI